VREDDSGKKNNRTRVGGIVVLDSVPRHDLVESGPRLNPFLFFDSEDRDKGGEGVRQDDADAPALRGALRR